MVDSAQQKSCHCHKNRQIPTKKIWQKVINSFINTDIHTIKMLQKFKKQQLKTRKFKLKVKID